MKRLFLHYLNSHSKLAQFLRFATVGIKISLIDAGILYALPYFFGMNLYLARVFSLGSSIMAGYVLNRYFTFGGNERGCFYRQMAGHFGVHLTGGVLNYGVFSAVVAIGHTFLERGLLMTIWPLIAIVIGGLVGLSFNFTLSKKLVFRHQTDNAKNIP
jgi:putative flippase GtrA